MWATLREGGVRDGIVVSSESSRDIEEHRARGTRAARTIKDKIYQHRVRARAIRAREERELTADFPKMRVPLLCVASHKGASHKSLLRLVSSAALQHAFITPWPIRDHSARDHSGRIKRHRPLHPRTRILRDLSSCESRAKIDERGVKPLDTPAKSLRNYARGSSE